MPMRQFGIAGGKSAVQNIVNGELYYGYIGYTRKRVVSLCIFEINNGSSYSSSKPTFASHNTGIFSNFCMIFILQ